MKTYTLKCELVAPTSIAETFAVFENPHNLALITPPWLNFRIASRERVVMRKGAEIDYTIRWLGLPMRWKTIITEYEPPFCFVDEQARGPYLLWRHRHEFHPSEQGTIVKDRVDYALPFGVFGRAAHRLLVARQLQEIFRFRQRKLAALLGHAVEIRDPAISAG